MTASEIKGWRSASISEVANVVRGSSPRPAKDPRYFNGSFLPWITVGDIVNSSGPYLERTESMLTEEGATHTRIMEVGTFLLTNSGARTLGVPKITLIRAGANDGVAALLNLASSINREFLFYQLQGQTVFFRQRIAAGNDQLNLNTDLIGALRIQIPPLPEQQEIAAILSTWDRAIELTEKMIAAKQKRKQALMQQLLTGKVRLRGHNGKWKTWKAGDIFKPISKKNCPNERVLSVTQDQGVVYRDQLDRKIGMNMDSTGTYKLVEAGDFVISLRSFQGGLEMSRIRGIVSPAYHVIRSAIEIDREFFRHFFKSYEFIGRLAVAVIGIRDGKQISFEDFSFLKFLVPSVAEQNAIGQFLNAAESEIATLVRKAMALKKQKQGLMQQLLTGKVRVNVDTDRNEGINND